MRVHNPTPGPWSWYKTGFGAKVVDVQDVTVADIPQQLFDTWLASDTARLISAAPELLAALIEVNITPYHPRTRKKVLSAISKATEGN